jgi:hypothetical protein
MKPSQIGDAGSVAAANVEDFCYVTAANAAQEGRQEFGSKGRPDRCCRALCRTSVTSRPMLPRRASSWCVSVLLRLGHGAARRLRLPSW